MYHVNCLALSFFPPFFFFFFFESGLNVHKLMHSLINNQLKRYWSKILIGITNDWTGNQSVTFSGFVSWQNFVGIKRGWLFRDQNDCDVTRSKLYPLKDCSRCSTHTLLFILFCFILFFFPSSLFFAPSPDYLNGWIGQFGYDSVDISQRKAVC